jgi:uncharacterized repeat protein (TIGR01451 family)
MNTSRFTTGIGRKKHILGGLLGILILLFSRGVTAKPLYVIGETLFSIESNIKTYDVFLNGSIEYVTENMIYARCKGPSDLAFTPDGRYMFTASGGSAWIQVVDTVTMTVGNEAHVSGTQEDFSGVAFDSQRELVYSVDLGQDQLYVHQWDRANASLTLAENGRITLPGTSTHDIALDLTNDLLFVSNGTNQIHVYNLGDWSLNRIIDLGYVEGWPNNVERIDLDERNQVLYAGTQVSGDPYLLQYDLLSTAKRTQKIRDDASVVGIAVDDSSSLVYVATLKPFYSEGSNQIHVFNGELHAIDQEQINGYIAGLGLPVEGISSSPLTVSKRIVTGTELIDGVHYARGGDVITYEICFENRSPGPVGNVQVVDVLPVRVDYLGADLFGGEGDMAAFYNPNHDNPVLHTYEISMEVLAPNSLRCALITVRLKDDLESGFTVLNKVTADSIQTPQVVAQANLIVWEGPPSDYLPLNISKDVFTGNPPNPITGLPLAFPGDILIYSLAVENPSSNSTVHDVSIVDMLPQEVDYLSSIDVNGLTGAYNPDFHSVIWHYPSLAPGRRITVELGVEVRPDVGSGIITNNASVTGDEVPETRAAVDVAVDGPITPPGVQAALTVYASELTGGNLTDELMCVLILPPQVNLSHVDRGTRLTLNPGGTESSYQIVYGRDGLVKITAYFDKAQLLAAIRGQSLAKLRVTGRLVGGEPFFGESTIPVSSNLVLQE